MSVGTRVLACAAVVGLTGCSITFGGPAAPRRDHTVHCTARSVGWALVDTGLSVGMVLGLGPAGETLRGCSGEGSALCGPVVLAALGLGLVATGYAISAATGFVRAAKCSVADAPDRIAKRRETSRLSELTNEAITASVAGDCERVKALEHEVQGLTGGAVWGTWFDGNAAVARCLRPAIVEHTTPAAPTRSCFDDTVDGTAVSVCFPAEAACTTALTMLPTSTMPRSCVARTLPTP